MPLETFAWDTLDFIKDDEDLAFVLNDALESGHGDYIDDMVATLERAKGLSAIEGLTPVQRLVRAADAVGLKLIGVPRAA